MTDLHDAMRATGMEPPKQIVAGITRFPGVGKKNNNRAGWVWLADDGQGAAYGDYTTGERYTWQADRGNLPVRDRHAIRAAQQRRQRETARRQDAAAVQAMTIWRTSTTPPETHCYLRHKCISGQSVRITSDYRLVIPLQMYGGDIRGLQFIAANGAKRFLRGAQVAGLCCYVQAGGADTWICEGWATTVTVAQHYAHHATVLAAITANNLLPVAQQVRDQHPQADITIVADDDRATEQRTGRNPGLMAARVAAEAVGARIVAPDWPEDAPLSLSDINDLHCWRMARSAAA